MLGLVPDQQQAGPQALTCDSRAEHGASSASASASRSTNDNLSHIALYTRPFLQNGRSLRSLHQSSINEQWGGQGVCETVEPFLEDSPHSFSGLVAPRLSEPGPPKTNALVCAPLWVHRPRSAQAAMRPPDPAPARAHPLLAPRAAAPALLPALLLRFPELLQVEPQGLHAGAEVRQSPCSPLG